MCDYNIRNSYDKKSFGNTDVKKISEIFLFKFLAKFFYFNF